MVRALAKLLAIVVGLFLVAGGALIGSYQLVRWLFSHWSADAHATFALCFVVVLLILGVSTTAIMGHRRTASSRQ